MIFASFILGYLFIQAFKLDSKDENLKKVQKINHFTKDKISEDDDEDNDEYGQKFK